VHELIYETVLTER